MSTQAFDSVRVPKAAELVASRLRMQIITGVLAENDALPSEAVLMSEFGVSRPTLREAFRILESESLISVRRGAHGGARVRVPDGVIAAHHVGYVLQYRGTTMVDVYRARTMLETPLGTTVAHDKRKSTLAQLEDSLASADEHLSDQTFVEHDVEFHLLVAKLAGNQTMFTMVDMLTHIVLEARKRYTEMLEPDELSMEHKEVHKTHKYFATLIARGEADAAARLWVKHLHEVEAHYSKRKLAATVIEMMG